MNNIKNSRIKFNRSVIIKAAAIIILLVGALLALIIYQNTRPYKITAEHFVETFLNENTDAKTFTENNNGKWFEITGYIDSVSDLETSGYIKCKGDNYSLRFHFKENEISKMPDWLCKDCKITIRAVYDKFSDNRFEFNNSEYISAVNTDLYIENTTTTASEKAEDIETSKSTQNTYKKATDKTEPQSNSSQRIVYYTKSGKKYHYQNPCGRGKYFECTLDDALAKGFEPCNKCVGAQSAP